jgi:hypothetical protein
MDVSTVNAVLDSISVEKDLNAKALLLAALVSELFREHGFEPVVVGGSAIEFYTDGAYMSGDTDVCWAGGRNPTPDERGAIMSQIPGVVRKGTRSWVTNGLWVDLLGDLNRYGNSPLTSVKTPAGEVVLTSVEELLVERVFAARKWTGYNQEDDQCAKKLVASLLHGRIPCDWAEARRIAAMPAYKCLDELNALMREVEQSLQSSS